MLSRDPGTGGPGSEYGHPGQTADRVSFRTAAHDQRQSLCGYGPESLRQSLCPGQAGGLGTPDGGRRFRQVQQSQCLLLLGGGFADEAKRYPQHSPYFDIDEKALGLGVEYFVQYVLEWEKELKK